MTDYFRIEVNVPVVLKIEKNRRYTCNECEYHETKEESVGLSSTYRLHKCNLFGCSLSNHGWNSVRCTSCLKLTEKEEAKLDLLDM